MPTYDYKCRACDHAWEEFQAIKAPATTKCPSCGKKKAERQIGFKAKVSLDEGLRQLVEWWSRETKTAVKGFASV